MAIPIPARQSDKTFIHITRALGDVFPGTWKEGGGKQRGSARTDRGRAGSVAASTATMAMGLRLCKAGGGELAAAAGFLSA